MEFQKHSGIGIASFIVSLVSGFFIFLLFAAAGVMEVSTPGGMDENAPTTILLGLTIFAFLGVSLLSLGLGIGGLAQKDRKKIFAVLGTVFSAVTLLGTTSIILLGLATD